MTTPAPLDAKQAEERVLGWQTKLHRWATQDERKRFDDVFNLLCDRATLLVAWERVKRNRGSKTAGVDGQTRRQVEQRGVETVLGELRQSLRDGSYAPLPVREHEIPKRGSGKVRKLGIPALRDRIVQMATTLVLEPIWEADFQPCSNGFRPNRRAQDAIEQVRFFINPPRSYEWAREGDAEDCFSSIHHGLLMEPLRRRLTDKRVLRLIRQFLAAGIMRDRSPAATPSGTPQGARLSPLLANVALSALDRRFEDAWNACTPHQRKWRMAKGHASSRMIRHADELVILVRGSKAQAEALKEQTAVFRREQTRLTLSSEKTRITHVDDGFDFLAAYAADRFVTIVPEVDTPGHAVSLVQLRPELYSGRNQFEFELPPGHKHTAVWLDPELPATFEVIEEVLAGVAEIFPSSYLHIGGDEPRGMPHDLYASYLQRVRDFVRSLGRRPLAWQESARAGLGADDAIQYWYTDIDLAPSLPAEVRAQQEANVALSASDVETAVAASMPVIVSPLRHCYLDVAYAEPSADPAQAERQGRVGLRLYAPRTVAESFEWEPAEVLGAGRGGLVSGVEAAIWAETIPEFDDLTFMLLPRLPGIAHKAWGDAAAATWTDHRGRLAHHGRLWEQDDLTYFRTSTVDWL